MRPFSACIMATWVWSPWPCCFCSAFLGLMFAPAPLKGLDKFDKVAAHDREATIAKLEKARRQKEIDDAVASGVVTVGIAPARH